MITRSRKRRRNKLFGDVPYDCWGVVISYFGNKNDFHSILRVVKGLWNHLRNGMNSGFTQNITYTVKYNKEFPQQIQPIVLNLEVEYFLPKKVKTGRFISGEEKKNHIFELFERLFMLFPNLEILKISFLRCKMNISHLPSLADGKSQVNVKKLKELEMCIVGTFEISEMELYNLETLIVKGWSSYAELRIEDIDKMGSLKNLSLDNVDIESRMLLQAKDRLEVLRLERSRIFSGLRIFCSGDSPIGPPILSLSQFPNLKYLYLHVVQGLGHLQDLDFLRELVIGDIKGISEIRNLPMLVELEIHGVSISHLKKLEHVSRLEKLKIYDRYKRNMTSSHTQQTIDFLIPKNLKHLEICSVDTTAPLLLSREKYGPDKVLLLDYPNLEIVKLQRNDFEVRAGMSREILSIELYYSFQNIGGFFDLLHNHSVEREYKKIWIGNFRIGDNLEKSIVNFIKRTVDPENWGIYIDEEKDVLIWKSKNFLKSSTSGQTIGRGRMFNYP